MADLLRSTNTSKLDPVRQYGRVITAPRHGGYPNRLRLDIRLVESPELIAMIDGRDVLGEVWDSLGPDPDLLLGPASPLIPTEEGAEVALRVSLCGDAGCGAVSARVHRDEREVVWDHFRWRHGRALPHLGPFRFDATEYIDEVERADRERDWESPDRRTGGLVAAALRSDDRLKSTGWEVSWAAPSNTAPWDSADYAPGVCVYLTRGERGIVLGFPTETRDPEERKAEICQVILAGEPAEWPVVERH
jgi:hypothetical protein